MSYKPEDYFIARTCFKAGAVWQKEQTPFSEEYMIGFAEWMNEQVYKYVENMMWRSKSRCIPQFPDFTTYIVIDEKGNNILPKGTFLTIPELLKFYLKSKQ